MRTLNQLSATFLILNAMTKSPINNAVISCNGKPGGYISKGNGYYIYKNLESYKYRFEIRCQGFAPQEVQVDINSKSDFNVICLMYYSVESAKLLSVNKPVGLATLGDMPIANTELLIVQEDKVAALRVAKTTDNTRYIELNCDYNRAFLYQSYTYETDLQNEIFIEDYDDNKKAYITKEPIDKNIKISSLLKPIWHVSTDEKGMFVFPISEEFTINELVNFSVKYKNLTETVQVARNANNTLRINF